VNGLELASPAIDGPGRVGDTVLRGVDRKVLDQLGLLSGNAWPSQ